MAGINALKGALLGISAIAMTFSTAAVAQAQDRGGDVFAARAAARAEQRAERQARPRQNRAERQQWRGDREANPDRSARSGWGEPRAARQQQMRDQRAETRDENRQGRQGDGVRDRRDGGAFASRGEAIAAYQNRDRARDSARREAYERNRRGDDARRERYERNRSYTDPNRGYGYGDGYGSRSDHRRDWNRNAWRNDRRYDWRDWREHNRGIFRIGSYYAPYRDYRYRRLGVGHSLQRPFFGQRYIINDPWRYRLPEAYGPYRWVRYYDDVMLVDVHTGRVADLIHNFFW